MEENPTPDAVCCDAPDEKTTKPCAVCGRPTCKNCRSLHDRKRICPACRAEIEEAIEEEKAGVPGLPLAIAGGAAGAILGGILWAVVAVVTDYEVGYVAIAVGALAGWGVVLSCGGKKGQTLQIVAVACSGLGLLLGKYFTVAHVLRSSFPDLELSWFDSRIREIFFENIGEFIGGYDVLWLILALAIAWKIPAPTKLRMTGPRRSSGAG